MNTVFKIIKDKKNTFYGADHFSDLDMLKTVVKIINDGEVESDLLYKIDGSKIQDIEAIINFDKQEVFFEDGLDLDNGQILTKQIFKGETQNFEKIVEFCRVFDGKIELFLK